MSPEEELVQIRTRPHISFSEWQGFRNTCQHKWYLDYIVKPEGVRQDRSIHFEFGTSMHLTIEDLLNPDPEKRVTLERAQELFEERYMKGIDELTDLGMIEYGPWHEKKHAGFHPGDLAEAGKRILRDLLEVPEIKAGRVVKFEHKLFVPFERTDSPISFKGFIDFMITLKDGRGKDVLLLGDFKTCQWGWPKDKKEDPDVCAQPILYKHGLAKEIEIDPKLVRTYFILLKKKPRPNDSSVELVRVNSSENATKTVISSLQTDVTRMRKGPPYKKNTDSCVKPWGVCRYYNTEHCPKEAS